LLKLRYKPRKIADKIFTDIDPGAYLTSVVSGIPLASTYAHIATHGSGTFGWKLMQRVADKVLRANRLPAKNLNELCFGEKVLKIIPSIPELDSTDADLPDVCYVGQLISPIQSAQTIDFQIEEGKQRVFVYVGTGSISLDTLQSVLPKVFPSNCELQCFVGAQSITTTYKIEAVEFHPYVPRRYNARKVEAAKAGIMGEVNMFTVDWLREAFRKQKECASQAKILRQRINSYDGPDAAVDAIQNWEKS
jgi:UDP:flavonoid glycosyltransferase YjiC (YdhE family)